MKGECQACGYKTEVKEYDIQGEKLELCELCAGTPSGNAAAFPDYYRENTTAILRTICYVGNAILNKLYGIIEINITGLEVDTDRIIKRLNETISRQHTTTTKT